MIVCPAQGVIPDADEIEATLEEFIPHVGSYSEIEAIPRLELVSLSSARGSYSSCKGDRVPLRFEFVPTRGVILSLNQLFKFVPRQGNYSVFNKSDLLNTLVCPLQEEVILLKR